MRLFPILLLVLPALPLAAATINVTSTADVLANDGVCTLREAVIAANTNAPSGANPGECAAGSSSTTDTIQLPSGQFNLTVPGPAESDTGLTATVGDLDVTQNLNIVGQGATLTTIDGAGLGARVLHIKATTLTANLSHLRIRNGSSAGRGGGIFFADGNALTLSSIHLVGNTAAAEGGGAYVTNTADLTIEDSLLFDNTALEGGGFKWFDCGGCTFTLRLSRTVLQANTANTDFIWGGGGAYIGDGLLFLDHVLVDENLATAAGGGLYLGGTAQVTDSTFSNNSAGYSGGGIDFDYPEASEFTNCTFSGNSAGVEGGAAAIQSNEIVRFTNSTIASNTAPTGSALATDTFDGTDFSLANTIISGTCSGAVVISLGGNIESPGDNCGLVHATDRVAMTEPQLALGALAANGGSTQTHLPAAGSLALNTARAVYCPETDQRNLSRPQGPQCDVGSVEGSIPFIFVDGFRSGDLSLWSASVP